jgi:predicted O-methyltransferase YrrM
MTSREATSLLPRTAIGGECARWQRSLSDWTALLGYGAIQWPWLLRSPWGGYRRDKRALLDRLRLPADALPNLGSWKADVGFLTRIVDHIETHRPAHVVELGSGASTLVTARALELHGGGMLTSFDQHRDFVEAVRSWLRDHRLAATIDHAPLIPAASPWPGLWYDLGTLPETIDLLLIDGPPWTLHPLVRGSAERLFDRIAPGGSVMLDDASRPGERVIASRWRRRWPDFRWTLAAGIKGTLVGIRNSQIYQYFAILFSPFILSNS